MAEKHLEELLGALSDGLRAQGIQAVLFGGFALPIYGVERVTLDLDFMLCEADVDAFAAVVETAGYAQVLRTEQYAKFRHKAPTALDIDTVFVNRDSMARIWDRGADHRLAGHVLRCASLDIMLGTKLHAIRYNEPNRGRRDFDDVVNLLQANGIDPAGRWFTAVCGKYGTPEILERLCRELHNKENL
jgi:hypothetical protein